MMTLLLTAAVLAANPAPDYALLHIQRNSAKVNTVEGTLVQGGLVESADVKATVVSSRPNLFSARITEPQAWAGISVTYDGKTLQSYYPQLRWAVRLRNLELPSSKAQLEELVAYQYGVNQRAYDYRIDGTSMVAGFSTLTMWHTARTKDLVDARGFTKVYDPYSFALAGELHFPRSTYTYRWDRIAFNGPVKPDAFSEAVPEGTLITDWDLAAPSVDEAAMRKEASFPIVLPDKNGLDLKRVGIARAAGPVPAFCVRYERGPHFLLVLANASAGASVPAYGIPLELGSASAGRLIPGPATSTYAFVREGTYYTLISNLPVEELMKVAAQLGSTRTL
jgi:hypothetical protein